MSEKSLRSACIRLASSRPDLRPYLLPLVKKAAPAPTSVRALFERYIAEGEDYSDVIATLDNYEKSLTTAEKALSLRFGTSSGA